MFSDQTKVLQKLDCIQALLEQRVATDKQLVKDVDDLAGLGGATVLLLKDILEKTALREAEWEVLALQFQTTAIAVEAISRRLHALGLGFEAAESRALTAEREANEQRPMVVINTHGSITQ